MTRFVVFISSLSFLLFILCIYILELIFLPTTYILLYTVIVIMHVNFELIPNSAVPSDGCVRVRAQAYVVREVAFAQVSPDCLLGEVTQLRESIKRD